MIALSRLSHTTDALRQRLDGYSLAERYGLLPASHSAGKWRLYHRPGQHEKKPSFGITRDGYKDFATGEHGDLFTLIQRLENCSFRRAVEIAAEIADGILPTRRPVHPTHRPTPARATPDWQQAAAAVLATAEEYLWSARPDARIALTYLRQTRRLTEATIRAFRLGYNPAWFKTGYLKPDDHKPAYLAPGLIIPTFVNGSLVALKVRGQIPDLPATYQAAAKYTQLAGGQPAPLFNGDAIQPDKPAVRVEGEFDVMAGQQAAGSLAVFVSNGSASNPLTEAARAQLARASRLFVAPDNDTAGETSARHLQALAGAERLTIPTGKDLSDFVADGGDIVAWLSPALTAPRPKILTTPDGLRSAALNCKLEAALILYELVRYTGRTTVTAQLLWKDNLQHGFGLSRDMIYRGLSLGQDIFFAKSDISRGASSTDQDSMSGFAEAYSVLPAEQIRAALRARLRYRLFERQFARRSHPLLPPLEPAMFESLAGDPAALAAELGAILAPVYAAQAADEGKRGSLQKRLNAVAYQYSRLCALLDRPRSSPIRWLPGAQYAAMYYRAVQETDPRNRSEYEIALLTGRQRQNVDGLILRAGVESRQRPSLTRTAATLAEFETTLEEAYAQARGQGKIAPLLALDAEDQVVDECVFEPHTAQAWAARTLAAGHRVAVTIYLKNEQAITGEVQLRAPRQPQGSSRPEAPPVEEECAVPPVCVPHTAASYDPLFVKGLLVQGYAALNGYGEVTRHRLEALTVELSLAGMVALLRAHPEAGDSLTLPDQVELLAAALGGRVTRVIESRQSSAA